MKTVIITGANGNLGTAVTSKFLDSGYRVVATVVNGAARGNLPLHDHLQVEVVNLTDESAASTFIQMIIDKYKQIDAALMLVGGFTMGDISATSGAELKQQFSLNFETAFYVARPLFQHMTGNNAGRLVFIGARPALQAADGKNLMAYGLSKSLLFKLAEYLNEAAKGTRVTATVLVPSTLDTPLNRKSMPGMDPDNWVKPQQLADVLDFIVSEKGAPLREPVLKVYNNA
jgi:NAD(P)-dependent dehydrogenase (short-subunit alcohol dehydrogenase family)